MWDQSGGLTLTAALAETDRLLPLVGEGRDRELLEDYRIWLVDRIERVTTFRAKRFTAPTLMSTSA
jgi:hypothetical protein